MKLLDAWKVRMVWNKIVFLVIPRLSARTKSSLFSAQIREFCLV